MKPENICTFLAFVIMIAVVIRGRRKVRCLETQMAMHRPVSEIREDAEKRYNENRLVQVVDLCRELEARVQNRSLLLEILIDDADERIVALTNHSQKNNIVHEVQEHERLSLGSMDFKKAFLKGIENGKSDEELAKDFNRTPLVMTLLRDLWRRTA